MSGTLVERFDAAMAGRQDGDAPSAVEIVDAMLESAGEVGASDVHLVPEFDGLQMLWRLDGVLHAVKQLPKELAPNIVARLKVLAELLTYKTEVPQEGRIRQPGESAVEMRLSTFPTMHGEKAVVRLFVGSGTYRHLDDLGLAADIRSGLGDLLLESGGVTIVCGPAGSGKTTTIYAALREVADKSAGQRSLVSLEDPIEAALNGVAQSQVNPAAGFDYATGLKSLMRQDPEVILVGEIRDRETAETVFQAALTGHLVLTTFHSGSAAEAICRLSDMGIEPYLLRTGLLAILAQRLVRKLCECSTESTEEEHRLGLPVETFRLPAGCERCRGTGYSGRILLAEFLRNESPQMARSILDRSDAEQLEATAVEVGMKTRMDCGLEEVAAGRISPSELRRVFGFAKDRSSTKD